MARRNGNGVETATEPRAPRGQADLFGVRPSFHRPRTGERRIGVVDVGSNSVRLVIFDGGARCPAVVFNEKVICELGKGLGETGRLNPEGRERARRALDRFVMLAQMHDVGALAGVATAAIREAEDGEAFRDLIVKETNIPLQIASGIDEARIAAQGVLFGDPAAAGVVADLGGASMELCRVAEGRTGFGLSTMLGPLSLPEGDDLGEHIDKVLAPIAADFLLDGATLFLVGGAWRALARMRMERDAYPMRLVHEYRMTAEEALDIARWVQEVPPERLADYPAVSSQRLRNMARTGALLERMIAHLGPGAVQVSAFGLREGLCYEYLPEHVRDLDPLIATAQRQERNRSRVPGFGSDLIDWLAPVVTPAEGEEERLFRAACHLADVCWRAHPEYRDVSCLEAVTRLNLSGAGHGGRAFLGAALIARYRSWRKARDAHPMLGLIDEAAHDRAGRLGALMRLGATLTGATPGMLRNCRLTVDDGKLALALTGPGRALAGEEVDKRHSQAARAMGLTPALAAG